ncbi:zinc-binding dehydrogenase [Gracilibacillus dipsosauri]|uniref:Alcohol dehydrogenase n=1 Tax=Gracilibacillus dipsosauri TaxID=178340 RepID=A0A317L5C6_9BACI|nr:zinc-binding dehydrogenase [Gracilibacillus dipsosauri]PWU69029.1 alcohol dehydrogenase [Gracilibacillus dipsosauri]
MKAYVVKNGSYQFISVNNPRLGNKQIKIKLTSAGLNHRDLMIKERFANNTDAYILGSDGAGIVDQIGTEVTRFQVGDEVMINPSLNWYEKSAAPPAEFEIVGAPFSGTFAEYIIISEDFAEPKPNYLTWEEAGVLCLSGITGFRALFTQGEIKSGQTLFIPGVGSGVNSFIIQLAKAIGARVITTSRDKNKLKEAEVLGFDRALLTDDDWEKLLEKEEIDLVIESIGGATFNRSLNVLKKGGRIVTFGSSTEDKMTLNLREFFYGQYQLIGSTMGSREELREMLNFIEKHQIRPLLDKSFPFKEIDQAFAYLDKQKQLGKIAITFE